MKLPPHLADKPYLKEFYGNVEWSVRNIYFGYLGWFNGNATNLFPLSLKERARHVAHLAGGEKALLLKTREALAECDFQWVLELTDQLLQLSSYRNEAGQMKAMALCALGMMQGNANARNYYLTQSLEVGGELTIPPLEGKNSVFLSLEMMTVLDIMAVNLNPEKSADIYMAAGFRFTDIDELYSVNIRCGVSIIEPYFLDKVDFIVICSSIVWKEIISKLISPTEALVKGDLKIDGNVVEFYKFLSLFNS